MMPAVRHPLRRFDATDAGAGAGCDSCDVTAAAGDGDVASVQRWPSHQRS
jgi:hypothetical protein